MSYIDELDAVAQRDCEEIREKDAAYGGSWKKRGGVGAAMMLLRKSDRLEQSLQKYGWDIFKAIEEDPRVESTLDDVRDLRRYLLLVESEIHARKAVSSGYVKVPTSCPCGEVHPSGNWCCRESLGDA